MRTAKCKCGERQAWGEMPPCAICEKCGTAPGYVNAEKPAPHRFSKKFDQNTGKPFNFCMVCGRKEEVLFEPKCSGCGHSEHKFLCLHTIELSNGEHDVCDCQSFSPAEPDATDEDFKIEPISQHTLKVPVQYKGQAEPLDFTEPDATERARAELEVKYQQAKEFYQAYRTPEMKLYNYPIGAMLTSFLESETPRIKAEAVREFVGKLTNKIDRSFVSGVPRKTFAKGTEVYQGYNNGLSTVLYILEKEFPEIAKEITEVD